METVFIATIRNYKLATVHIKVLEAEAGLVVGMRGDLMQGLGGEEGG